MMLSKLKQTVLFCEYFNKLKPSGFRNWCLDFFNLWNILMKLGIFTLSLVICAVLFFVFRTEALNGKFDQPVFNKGAGLSLGSDWPQPVVYALKSIISIVFIIFSITINKWYLYVCFYIIGINSLFNVIDKAIVDVYLDQSYYDAVVDYIYWAAFNFTNNVADIFIVTFVIISIVSIIAYIIINIKKERNNDNKENIYDKK